MEYKDYYKVLGVGKDANADEVKKAFRRLARQYHPDVSKAADAAVRMAEVNEAYAVLSDPERRAAFDALGDAPAQGQPFTPPPGWDDGFEFSGSGGEGESADYSDFFAELFGRMGAQARARRGDGAQAAGAAGMRGEDHHARILLDVEDAWHGATRDLTLRRPELDEHGRVSLKERRLQVRIPVGVRPGQTIRLAGQGGEGRGSASAGDLFLEVSFRPHPRFRLDGADIYTDLPVAPWEAALGAVVPVVLPSGATLKVRVPAGAQGGRLLRVRGKGWPAAGQAPAGDLQLQVRVVLPSALDPRAREQYERMAQALPDFDARRTETDAA